MLQSHSVFWVMALWYGFASLVLFGVLACQGRLKKDWIIFREHCRDVFLMGLFGALSAISWFWGIAFLGVSGYAILGPIASALLMMYGVVVLKERLSAIQSICVFVILGGGILIALKFSGGLELAGMGCIVFNAFAGGAYDVWQKKLSPYIDGFYPIFLRALFSFLFIGGVLVVSAPALPEFSLPVSHVFLIVLGGLMGAVLAHMFRMRAYKTENLSVVIPIRAANPIWLFFIGLFLLGEPANDFKIIVGSIMLAATFSLALISQKKRRI